MHPSPSKYPNNKHSSSVAAGFSPSMSIRVGFAQIPGLVRDNFVEIVEKLGSKPVITTDSRSKWVDVGVKVQPNDSTGKNPVKDMVKSWGMLYKKSNVKSFPDFVWKLPNRQLALVLRGLFDTDGCFGTFTEGKKGGRTGTNGIPSIGLTSERLVRDIEWAMLRLGISGIVSFSDRRIIRGEKYPVWNWRCRKHEDVVKFAETIGSLKHKEVLDHRVSCVPDWHRTQKWDTYGCPEGYHWEQIKSVKRAGKLPTATISVEHDHTYVTTFVEHNSYASAVAVIWFLFTRPDSKVITTASNWRQVQKVLWPQIHEHLHKMNFKKIGWVWPIRPNDTMLRITQEWFATGESSDDPQKLEGFHADHIMYVVDEAKLVSEKIVQSN